MKKTCRSAKKCLNFEKNSAKVNANAKHHEHLLESMNTEECKEVWSQWTGNKFKECDECVWSVKSEEVKKNVQKCEGVWRMWRM